MSEETGIVSNHDEHTAGALPPVEVPPATFVVSRRTTGLGDCLLSLVSAWRYARDTGRTLVVDWRRSCYSEDPEENVFERLFEPLTELAGVAVRLAPVELTESSWPLREASGEASRDHRGTPWLQRLQSLRKAEKERLEAVAMIKSGSDVSWPTVRFEGCLPVLPEPSLCRRALEGLTPKGTILEEVDRFARRHFAGRPVVGVHIRHGNGGDILDHAKYWDSSHRPIESCVRTIRALQEKLGSRCVVFLCTDSIDVLHAISGEVDGLVARDKTFLPSGDGELHLQGKDTAFDALVEMLLLRLSTALVRHPPDSYFSWWASLYAPEIVSPVVLVPGADS